MRNHKFRFSAMIPSEWFHKLMNITKPRKKLLSSYSLNTTKKKKTSSVSKSFPHSSSFFLSNKSHTSLESKIQSKRKTVYKPSPPSSSSVSAGFSKEKIKFIGNQDSSAASSNLKPSSSANDIMEKACTASNRTKESRNLSVKIKNKEKEKEEEGACRIQKKHQKVLVSSGRRSSANSPRIKLKVSSPRIRVSSNSRSQRKQFLDDSFAVIKNSIDPKKDFRESMVEMIEENNIRESKDLMDLLECYLSLNHKEYHDLIIKVFVQVWLHVINKSLM